MFRWTWWLHLQVGRIRSQKNVSDKGMSRARAEVSEKQKMVQIKAGCDTERRYECG
jgi:hypothetical protein